MTMGAKGTTKSTLGELNPTRKNCEASTHDDLTQRAKTSLSAELEAGKQLGRSTRNTLINVLEESEKGEQIIHQIHREWMRKSEKKKLEGENTQDFSHRSYNLDPTTKFNYLTMYLLLCRFLGLTSLLH